MAPSGNQCGAKRKELPTPLRLQVGHEVEKRRGGRKRVLKGMIPNAVEEFGILRESVLRIEK